MVGDGPGGAEAHPINLDLLGALREHRVMAIVRGRDRDASLRSLLTLAEAGIVLAEVSLTGQDALSLIEQSVAALGGNVMIGAGTVISAADASRAAEAGAAFLVSPHRSAGIAEAPRLGLPALTGALTPTEVAGAYEAGAAAVKVFPASLGGPAYLRALRDPFPVIPLVPVGGVSLASVPDYLDAGAVAVGIGAPLLGDATNGGDLADLRHRAAEVLRAASVHP